MLILCPKTSLFKALAGVQVHKIQDHFENASKRQILGRYSRYRTTVGSISNLVQFIQLTIHFSASICRKSGDVRLLTPRKIYWSWYLFSVEESAIATSKGHSCRTSMLGWSTS